MSEQEFAKTQKTAGEEALTLLQASRKMGDSQVVAAAESEVQNLLDQKISYFMAVNQNNRTAACQKLEETVNEILRNYEAELESQVDDTVLNQEAFNYIHNQVVSNARQAFQNLQCQPLLESQGTAMLDHQFQNADRWLDPVKRNRDMAEQALSTLADTSAIEFWNALSSSDSKDLKDLKQVEAQERSKALQALKTFPRKLDRDMFERGKNDLTAKLDGMYIKVLEPLKNKLRLEREQKDVQVAMHDAVRKYRDAMDLIATDLTRQRVSPCPCSLRTGN